MQSSNFQPPTEFSAPLAEETGIHIGDGYMNIYPNQNSYNYIYSGHAIDDHEFGEYIKKLMLRLYKISPTSQRVQKNTLLLGYKRKKLIEFKIQLGLPLGHKKNIIIPKWILDNSQYQKACLAGIFATDGCLVFQKKYKKVRYYPQLKITSKSKPLIKQIEKIFTDLGIKTSIVKDGIRKKHPNPIWDIYIYGKSNLKKFIKHIGFINPKHQKKYKKWRWREFHSA